MGKFAATSRREAESLHHSNELRQRIRLHLLEDVSAVILDRPLGGRDLASDLLIAQAGNNEWQDLTLARRELFVSLSQIVELASRLMRHARAFDGLADGGEKVAGFDRLGQELHG